MLRERRLPQKRTWQAPRDDSREGCSPGTDKYDRLLRYVLTDEVFVNRELVREGYAEVREYRPDTAYHKVFEAVLKKTGILVDAGFKFHVQRTN